MNSRVYLCATSRFIILLNPFLYLPDKIIIIHNYAYSSRIVLA
jgi:hypothetical protein